VTQVIDRRVNGKRKSAVNRQRFLKRFKLQIKKAVSESIDKRSITNVGNGKKISIPPKDISEPAFHHGQGGQRENILPGNTDFIAGDRINRPPKSGSGSGSEASNEGEGNEDFMFELSRDEFIEFFFEDLALPDLVKTQLTAATDFKSIRAGHTSDGVPTNINIIRSLKGALARRIALRAPHKKHLRDAEEELKKAIEAQNEAAASSLRREIELLKKKIASIPFIDSFDLRYNNRTLVPKPTSQAVMFCLMDVSGSMDEERKNIAKRFFTLLYLFLTKNYEHIDLVFIRHHTTAKEVDEDEFFHSRETGGTVVSSALDMMHKIILDRYPTNEWNIYGAQASDGDNWHDDSAVCKDILGNKIMPLVQYYAYVEITAERHQLLWKEYETIAEIQSNFAMQDIKGLEDIYPVFRRLFKKQMA